MADMYKVFQLTITNKIFCGEDFSSIPEVERCMNTMYGKGYELHTLTASTSHDRGIGGTDKTKIIMVFKGRMY